MIVRLTRMGRKQFKAMATAHEQWLQQLLAPLDSESASDLYKQLGKLRQVLSLSEGA